MTEDKKPEPIRDIECEDAIRRIFEYVDDELDDLSHSELEHHLHHCRSCLSRADFEKALKNRVHETGGEKAPDTLYKKIHSLIEDF